MKECRTQTHVHCLLIFNQRDYTDCTELLLSHTEGTELTNGKVKTENGKLVWMILLLIIFEDNVFATLLLESNCEYRKTLIIFFFLLKYSVTAGQSLLWGL